jgi:agmatinase
MTLAAPQPLAPAGAPLGLPFGGPVSFLRAPLCEELATLDADVVVLGVPSDEGSGWLPGARFGPRKLREISMRFRGGVVGDAAGFWDVDEERAFLEDELRERRIADGGDVDVVLTRPDLTWDNVTRAVAGVLGAGALPVVLGGDHAITYPAIRAYEQPLTVVQLDAHVDYQPLDRVVHSHANPMRLTSGLAHVERIVHAGVRSFRTPRQDALDSARDGNVLLSTRRLRAAGPGALLEVVPAGEPVYVTIDVDVLDPPLVPGTGSPEPSGLSYDELRELLAALAGHARVVGFDLVEVNPLIDIPSAITSFLGVQLVVEFLARIMAAQPARRRTPQHAEETHP